MLQDYRLIREDLEQGKYLMGGTWEQYGPLIIQNNGGEILIGDVQFQGPVRLQVGKGGHMEIGDYSSINYGCEFHCMERLILGKYLLISWNVTILDTDYHGIGYSPAKKKQVIVEDGAWIGNSSTILKGVTVGKGSLVASGSVVSKDVPQFTIVSGNPAKIIKEIEPFEGKHGQIYERKWWDPDFVPKPKPGE